MLEKQCRPCVPPTATICSGPSRRRMCPPGPLAWTRLSELQEGQEGSAASVPSLWGWRGPHSLSLSSVWFRKGFPRGTLSFCPPCGFSDTRGQRHTVTGDGNEQLPLTNITFFDFKKVLAPAMTVFPAQSTSSYPI